MFQTTTYLSLKEKILVVLFVIGFIFFCIYFGDQPPQDEDAPYETVCSRLEDRFWDFPDDALNTLEAYIYQYTDDYEYVSQSEAEEAYETIRSYCYSFYDVLD